MSRHVTKNNIGECVTMYVFILHYIMYIEKMKNMHNFKHCIYV